MSYEFRQLIDGQWCDALGGASWDLLNPATEERIRTVPFGAGEDCLAAIEAASAVQSGWAAKTAYERAAILKAASDMMRARAPELGRYTTLESGKPLAQGVGEWSVAAYPLRVVRRRG